MATITVLVLLSVAAPRGAEEALAAASGALEAGDARGALEVLEDLTSSAGFASLEPGLRTRTWALLGLAWDPERAAPALEAALEAVAGQTAPSPLLDPPMAEAAALSLARVGLEMKDGELARSALARLSPEARARHPARGLLPLSLFFEGDARGAEAAFHAAHREKPAAQSAFYLGVILFDRGEREAALARFEEAARLDPGDYYARIYRARALLELNRPGDAVAALEGIASAFKTPEVYYLLGKARLREDRFEEAERLFQKALDLNRDYPEALFGLGTALRRLGKSPEAHAVLEKFQALHRAESERLRRADALSQALLRNPRDAAAAETLSRFSLESGDLEAAERHAWRAVRLEPARHGARLILARALARSGRYAAAAIHYQRILKADPAHADARAELEDLVAKHSKRRE
jgi:tetratricopeptide (TPR) repeat protein